MRCPRTAARGNTYTTLSSWTIASRKRCTISATTDTEMPTATRVGNKGRDRINHVGLAWLVVSENEDGQATRDRVTRQKESSLELPNQTPSKVDSPSQRHTTGGERSSPVIHRASRSLLAASQSGTPESVSPGRTGLPDAPEQRLLLRLVPQPCRGAHGVSQGVHVGTPWHIPALQPLRGPSCASDCSVQGTQVPLRVPLSLPLRP